MRRLAVRLLAWGVFPILFLGLAADSARATNFASNLLCLSNNTVNVTSVEFWCEREACGEPQAACGALPNATWNPSLSCQGVTGPDGQAGVRGVETDCPAGCELAARITYNCNGGPNRSACLRVPTPGSGQSASVDLTCSPGARLTLEEGACVQTAKTLCFLDDRYRLQLSWGFPSGQTGQGQAVQLTGQSGSFYFLNPANLEFLIKMINACTLNNRYWLFSAATTNVEFTLTVTDTLKNQSKQYKNPQGRPAPPIQDTDAFATCP